MLTLPDFNDATQVRQFYETVRTLPPQQRGLKTLLKHCGQMQRYTRLLHRTLKRAEQALCVANGQRTTAQLSKDHERGWRNAAQRFYDTLTTDELLIAAWHHGYTVESSPPCIDQRSEVMAFLVTTYVERRRKAQGDDDV